MPKAFLGGTEAAENLVACRGGLIHAPYPGSDDLLYLCGSGEDNDRCRPWIKGKTTAPVTCRRCIAARNGIYSGKNFVTRDTRSRLDHPVGLCKAQARRPDGIGVCDTMLDRYHQCINTGFHTS